METLRYKNRKEFFHDFLGFGNVRSQCKVTIITDKKDKHLILFEDLGLGTSVTNASEMLAQQIVNTQSLDPVDCRFFETYKEYGYDTFDEIIYDWKYVSDYDHKNYEYMKKSQELFSVKSKLNR